MIPHAYFAKVKAYFHGDTDKTWAWFKTPHPALGQVSPLMTIKAGRWKKVKTFIDNALDKNKGVLL